MKILIITLLSLTSFANANTFVACRAKFVKAAEKQYTEEKTDKALAVVFREIPKFSKIVERNKILGISDTRLGLEQSLHLEMLKYSIQHQELFDQALELFGITTYKYRLKEYRVHYAAEHGFVQTLKALSELGYEINSTDKKGNTALHIVSKGGKVSTLQVLIGLGSHVNAKNMYGNTPLHEAAKGGKLENLIALERYGAIIGAENADKITPLHWAVKHNSSSDVAQWLIENGADIHAKDINGRTPLFYAATNRTSTENLELLVRLGASSEVIDNDGRLPVHSASKNREALKAFKKLNVPVPFFTFFRTQFGM